MKVLVIGGGGREHAIVDALSRSPQVEKIFCAPGNAGITAQAECVAIRETEVERLRDFAAQNGIGLTVVGPEVALAAGGGGGVKAAGVGRRAGCGLSALRRLPRVSSRARSSPKT